MYFSTRLKPVDLALAVTVMALGFGSLAYAQGAGPFNPQELRLIVGTSGDDGAPAAAHVNTLFSTEQGVRRAMETLAPDICRAAETLGQCIDDVDRATAELTGLSATHIDQLLFVARAALDGNGGFQGGTSAELTGRISDCPDGYGGWIPGYSYTYGPGTGRLCVTTITKNDKLGKNKSESLYQFYYLTAGPFHIESKTTLDPSNVFPLAHSWTDLKVDEKMASGFLWKLFAAGKELTMVQYWRASMLDSSGEPDWEKFVRGQPGLPADVQKIFEPDPNACVDMMFADVPPQSLGPHDKPPSYCLGRCKQPPIVNTL